MPTAFPGGSFFASATNHDDYSAEGLENIGIAQNTVSHERFSTILHGTLPALVVLDDICLNSNMLIALTYPTSIHTLVVTVQHERCVNLSLFDGLVGIVDPAFRKPERFSMSLKGVTGLVSAVKECRVVRSDDFPSFIGDEEEEDPDVAAPVTAGAGAGSGASSSWWPWS